MKEERGKLREERGERREKRGENTKNHVIPPSLIRRGMESLTVYSECRDAIHRMINHPLWHDVLMKGDKITITARKQQSRQKHFCRRNTCFRIFIAEYPLLGFASYS